MSANMSQEFIPVDAEVAYVQPYEQTAAVDLQQQQPLFEHPPLQQPQQQQQQQQQLQSQRHSHHGTTASLPYSTTNDDGFGPDRLYAILEDALPRHDETQAAAMTPEEIQRRREFVEQAWDQVRKWLWTHESQEERAAAVLIRGQGDVTPLHLICKLSNPPTEIIHELVVAAPEVVGIPDSHGWLPLHHACASGASTEVIELLTNALPESKLFQDNQNRTPLHFYATRNSDNPSAMSHNVAILSDTGAAELADRGGMIPLHYACAYGTNPAVLKVLAEAYPPSLNAKELKGRTPLHLAMVNAHRDASPGVLNFLLENAGKATVNVRDQEGNLPLHLLNLGLKGQVQNTDDQDKLNNVSECLKLYLAAEPHASPDFLAALQDLPDWLQDVAVVSPHVRNILNQRIIQRFPTFFLMLDGIMLLTIIVCFESATTLFIDTLTEPEDPQDILAFRIVLFCGAGYFFLRELIQVIASLSLGVFSSWFYDTTNWLDVLVITMVTYCTVIMSTGNPIWTDGSDRYSSFRACAAITKGVLWTAVIYFLKGTRVDFAVFLNGVFFVLQRLVAFLLAVLVILIAFAQMFWIVYMERPVCLPTNEFCDVNFEELMFDDPMECQDELASENCRHPHCDFGDSFLKVYTMLMGEIGSETRYDDVLPAQIIYILYGFLVVILLSNVLIAIVTDSYEVIQNDRAAIVFWSNRLDFVAEMDGISSVIRRRIFCMGGEATRGSPEMAHAKIEQPNGATSQSMNGKKKGLDGKEWFSDAWKTITALFEDNDYDDVDLRPGKIEWWIVLMYKVVALMILPLWVIVGFFSIGTLWPSQVREWLLVQKETQVSRAEIERRKLQQLREIQNDMKSLKNEMRKEMANDRDEMFRMKAEVDAVQGEVLSDLQQVKELMTTLLDLGGISVDR